MASLSSGGDSLKTWVSSLAPPEPVTVLPARGTNHPPSPGARRRQTLNKGSAAAAKQGAHKELVVVRQELFGGYGGDASGGAFGARILAEGARAKRVLIPSQARWAD